METINENKVTLIHTKKGLMPCANKSQWFWYRFNGDLTQKTSNKVKDKLQITLCRYASTIVSLSTIPALEMIMKPLSNLS